MKTRLLIIIAIGIIGFTGIAFANHDPNQPQTHSIILPPDMKEKTFDEFMEWCEPYYEELCTKLEKNRIPIILSPLKQFKSGITIDGIQCKKSLILVTKYDGSSACVKEKSIPKLFERGWTIEERFHGLTKSQIIDIQQAELGCKKIGNQTYCDIMVQEKIDYYLQQNHGEIENEN